jgi:hypothetical protein
MLDIGQFPNFIVLGVKLQALGTVFRKRYPPTHRCPNLLARSYVDLSITEMGDRPYSITRYSLTDGDAVGRLDNFPDHSFDKVQR